jgi:transcriptional regulator with XRE-family HTH domain
MSSTFSQRLAAARELRQLTQSQLAEKSGFAPSAINHFEQGRRSPSFDNLRRLANALNVTTDYLLGRTDDPNLCGPEADKMFKGAENLSAADLETIALMVEAMKRKNQNRKDRDNEHETSG